MIDHTEWIKSAPDNVLKDAIEYYTNKRLNYNKKRITLTAEEKRDLISFQQAVSSIGITRKDFNNSVTI